MRPDARVPYCIVEPSARATLRFTRYFVWVKNPDSCGSDSANPVSIIAESKTKDVKASIVECIKRCRDMGSDV